LFIDIPDMKKRYIVLLAGLLALAGCGKEPGPAGAGEITVEASVGPMTKVSYTGNATDFTAGDRLALYAWTGSAASVPAERVVNGVVNTFDGSTWTPASLMRWADASTPHYFLGVSPAPAAAITDLTAVPYTLDPADYTASDLLLASNFGTDGAGVKPSATPVPLAFDHAMAKLVLNFRFGSEWDVKPTTISVTVQSRTGATVNYLTQTVTATGDAKAVPLSAAASAPVGYDLSYSVLQVPQTGVRTIKVTAGGVDYIYNAASDIPLNGGKYTTLGLLVGREKIALGDISVVDWETETLAEAEAEPDMLHIPLTIEAAEAGAVVQFDINPAVATNPVLFRTWNGTAWSGWATYTDNDPVTLASIGDRVQFRAETTNACYGGEVVHMSHFDFTKDCYVYGNIMSLINGAAFGTATELTVSHTFDKLFNYNTHLLAHPLKPLLLPATTLTDFCYHSMFDGCTSLTTAPALPALSLTNDCYEAMFRGCTSLTVAPVLPAPHLTESCYLEMFFDCSQLSSVTCLAVDISAFGCTSLWLGEVALTGTFTAPACMKDVWSISPKDGIPIGWTFVGNPGGSGAEGFTLSYPGEWE
jgi:hypothetical protein